MRIGSCVIHLKHASGGERYFKEKEVWRSSWGFLALSGPGSCTARWFCLWGAPVEREGGRWWKLSSLQKLPDHSWQHRKLKVDSQKLQIVGFMRHFLDHLNQNEIECCQLQRRFGINNLFTTRGLKPMQLPACVLQDSRLEKTSGKRERALTFST